MHAWCSIPNKFPQKALFRNTSKSRTCILKSYSSCEFVCFYLILIHQKHYAYAMSLWPFLSYGERPLWPRRIAHSVNNVQKKRQPERFVRFQSLFAGLHNTRLNTTTRTAAHNKATWLMWLQQKRNTFVQPDTWKTITTIHDKETWLCSTHTATSKA